MIKVPHRIIVEQSLERNSSLYINFIHYEKAFDSVDRATLWKPLKYYGIPKKIITIIQQSYEGMSLQSGVQRPAFRLLQCHDSRSKRMLAIIFHVSSCYRLDFEDHHRGNKECNSVEFSGHSWRT